LDLFKFFHPHHNPRLRTVPLRLQELAELEQAAGELRRAVRRAKLRCECAPLGGILPEHFSEILNGLDYVVESLSTLTAAHPGDDVATIFQMVEERRKIPGWETWTEIVTEKLLAAGENIGKVA
jgi:hypothetical protein